MIYPENFESKIKFDKIRQLISAYCLSDMGKELVDDLSFMTDPTGYSGRPGRDRGTDAHLSGRRPFSGLLLS